MLLKLFASTLFVCSFIYTVDGLSVLEKAKKWTVGIELNGKRICAGALVHSKWILTLAECISESELGDYTVTFEGDETGGVVESRLSKDEETLVLLKLQSKVLGKVEEFLPILANKLIKTASSKTKIESEISYWSASGDFTMSDINIVGDSLCEDEDFNKKRHICYVSKKTNIVCSAIPGLSVTSVFKKKWSLLGFSTSEENVCDGAHRKVVEIAPHYGWINSVLKEEVRCSVPGTKIKNGVAVLKVKSDNIKPGAEAIIMCKKGFDASPETIACKDNGKWEEAGCIFQDYNKCGENPCVNGECINIINDFYCSCNPGWRGKTCSEEINECDSNPCVNGLCNDSINGFTCDCYPGWKGCVCSEKVSCDFPGKIENGVAIVNAISDVLMPGTEATIMCKNEYNASPETIVCMENGAWQEAECILQDYNKCGENPCINGECINIINDFYCSCNPGWRGKTCSEEINECESSPCLNGFCNDSINGFTCDCNPGWTGCLCSEDINECLSSPCVNGICNNLESAFSCNCTPGWTGKTCAEDVNECDANPCVNGNCSNLENAFSCRCNPGWTGATCSEDINECDSTPCVNGNCNNLENDFSCDCKPGWTGKTCSQDINECIPNPCINADKCTNLENDFSCSCSPGWTGKTCSQDINECDTNPCIHGACSNLENAFSCTCDDGWTGDLCADDINECASSPCVNGTCSNLEKAFSCNCDPGFTGETCSQDINECDPDPCVHGTCSNLINAYSCHCDPNWGGENCDQTLCNGVVCDDSNFEICYNSSSCECDPRKKLEVGGDNCVDSCNEFLPYNLASSYKPYYGEGGVFCRNTGLMSTRMVYTSVAWDIAQAECLSYCMEDSKCVFVSHISNYGVCVFVSSDCPLQSLYRKMTMDPTLQGFASEALVTAVSVRQCAV